jgi:regulatory protein
MRSDELGPESAEDGPGQAARSADAWAHTGPARTRTPERDSPEPHEPEPNEPEPNEPEPNEPGHSAVEDPVARARSWLTAHGVALPAAEAEPPALVRRAPAAAVPPVGEDEPSSTGSAPGKPGEPDADPEAVARTIVLRKLAAQARTRAELEKALQAKSVPAAAAMSVLDRMEAVGLVDDEEFARDWVASRQQRRYLSKSALRRELSGKGVAREEIDSALEGVDQDAELAAARALVSRKARVMAGLDHRVRYRRLAGMLGRRGFNPGVVSRVLDEMLLDDDTGSSH